MPDKIIVIRTLDAEHQECFAVSAPTLGELATKLGVEEDRLFLEVDNSRIQQQRRQEVMRLMNSPEALRARDIDPITGGPVS